ncbi:glutamyl-tRNA reductase [Kineococcus xinjiangensis]|uniref:Glutamyl-tRNA reductase n=1 Tax=Kineococcus xinjiangensis TaxID=512762 RepID=A0A2S6IH54_9ACTN|nr:glutamyl-tRNA reductase [Kineococcus xinjiangensis]PPK93500.1 glutamyl-tRNA reductase [Kineococcus xinjiangensis]
MSLLVVGLSHRTASLDVLERAAFDAAGARTLVAELLAGSHVGEAVVLSTCNRVEVHCDVTRFHGGVADVGAALCRRIGAPLEELGDQLYVHYEDAAVEHLFSVACGLDSMAVGESQILGQLRAALRQLQADGGAGGALDALLQQALRVGKRAHTETGLDAAGGSLVEASLSRARDVLGDLGTARAVVVGAGAMSALVATTLHRAGVGSASGGLVVANRTAERAERLAAAVAGRAADLADLTAEVAAADLVVSCTGAVGHVLDAATVSAGLPGRDGRPLVLVDLALPRDIDPAVAELPGVHLVGLEALGADLAGAGIGADLRSVRQIVAEEVAAYAAARRAADVAPTVVALRAQARHVAEVELRRLEQRTRGLDPVLRAEVERTVHRIVDKLLHTPTVRVKELAEEPDGAGYAAALRALFDLDVTAVARVGEAPLSGTVADAVGGHALGGAL